MLYLAHCMDRAELMGCDTNNLAGRAVLLQEKAHSVVRVVQMILIADKYKVGLTGEHVNDICNNRFSAYLYKWLWDLVTRSSEALAKTGHWNNYLHKVLFYILSWEYGSTYI